MEYSENMTMQRYFDWMVDLVCDKRYTRGRSWRRMLFCLDQWDFTYTLAMDENRELDGIELRRRFERETGNDISELDGFKCSVLEMMLALASRCENYIMTNPDIGNRTGEWFWDMIENLGLAEMDDNYFDEEYFNFVIERLLNREYAPDGNGGLFLVSGRREDLRNVDIWYQAMWYLTQIIQGGYLK